MWIMTPFGILMPALRPVEHTPEGDDRAIQVRTRQKAYLDIFRERYCPELGESINFPDQDYQWKAYCTHQQLADAMARLMLDIDYKKFKPECDRRVKRQVGKSKKDGTPIVKWVSKWGLPWKLASELHSCYTTLWGVQLKYGDGTSVYDVNWSTGDHFRAKVTKGTKGTKPQPQMCKGGQHYLPRNWQEAGLTDDKTCYDCGQKNVAPRARAAWPRPWKPAGHSAAQPYLPSTCMPGTTKADAGGFLTGLTGEQAGYVPQHLFNAVTEHADECQVCSLTEDEHPLKTTDDLAAHWNVSADDFATPHANLIAPDSSETLDGQQVTTVKPDGEVL